MWFSFSQARFPRGFPESDVWRSGDSYQLVVGAGSGGASSTLLNAVCSRCNKRGKRREKEGGMGGAPGVCVCVSRCFEALNVWAFSSQQIGCGCVYGP